MNISKQTNIVKEVSKKNQEQIGIVHTYHMVFMKIITNHVTNEKEITEMSL